MKSKPYLQFKSCCIFREVWLNNDSLVKTEKENSLLCIVEIIFSLKLIAHRNNDPCNIFACAAQFVHVRIIAAIICVNVK